MTKIVDEKFEAYVNEAAVYEDALTKDFRPALASARNAFSYRFNVDGKFFNLLKDLQYYQGGYPSPESPPKIDVFVEKLAAVARWYEALGKLDELNDALDEACGMRLETTPNYVDPTEAVPGDPKKTEKYLDRIDPSGGYRSMTPAELAQFILDRGCDAQGDICYNADQIKITIGEKVDLEYGMKPSRFRDVVRVRSKLNLGKDPSKIIESNEDQEEQYDITVNASREVVAKSKEEK